MSVLKLSYFISELSSVFQLLKILIDMYTKIWDNLVFTRIATLQLYMKPI